MDITTTNLPMLLASMDGRVPPDMKSPSHVQRGARPFPIYEWCTQVEFEWCCGRDVYPNAQSPLLAQNNEPQVHTDGPSNMLLGEMGNVSISQPQNMPDRMEQQSFRKMMDGMGMFGVPLPGGSAGTPSNSNSGSGGMLLG